MRRRNRVSGYYDSGSRDMSPFGTCLAIAIILAFVLPWQWIAALVAIGVILVLGL
jgi:hypothetical protein